MLKTKTGWLVSKINLKNESALIARVAVAVIILALLFIAVMFFTAAVTQAKELNPNHKVDTATKINEAGKNQVPELSYSSWINLVKEDPQLIETATIKDLEIITSFKDGSSIQTSIPANLQSEPYQLAASQNIPLWMGEPESVKEPASIGSIFTNPISTISSVVRWIGNNIWILLMLVAGSFLITYLINRNAIHKSHADRIESDNESTLSFDDVAGCDEVVEEVKEIVDFIRDPEPFLKLGAKVPTGIILHGPPGTGKTLLARALANEASIPFYYAAGSSFNEQYIGVGAKRVREIFSQAGENENGALIFIDEIDALGGKRTGGDGSPAGKEHEVTLNQLLTEMDGFKSNNKVIVIAATNQLDKLDDALLRPGRFTRQVAVPLPDQKGREDIIDLYAAGKPLADDVDLKRIAEITANCSGADLENIFNEGAIMAARAGQDQITHADLIEGLLKAVAGPERKHQAANSKERRIVAIHEAGHALCSELLPNHDKVELVTIRARNNGAGGLALYGRSDKMLTDLETVEQQLITLLGGRAAEKVVFGEVTSGAVSDLQQANQIARRAVEQFGFNDSIGQILHDGQRRLSERVHDDFDTAVVAMVNNAYDEAADLIEKHKQELIAIADCLDENDVITRKQMLEAIGKPVNQERPAWKPRQEKEPEPIQPLPQPVAVSRVPIRQRIRSAVNAFRRGIET